MLDGTTVRLADHPNLETVSSGILGLGGVREMTGALVALPDGSQVHHTDLSGSAGDGEALGREAGRRLRAEASAAFFTALAAP